MNLIDRPSVLHEDLGHRGLSAMASMTLHVGIGVLLVAAIQLRPNQDAGALVSQSLVPHHLVWFPHVDAGGGRAGGGDHSVAPARQARLIGRDAVTVAAAEPQPSIDATNEMPEEVSAIPARPMADATQVLAGVIQSDSAIGSLGRGETGAADTAGDDRGGLGKRPGGGFGDGAHGSGPGVTMPTLIEQVRPRYTADAMRARVQGSVWVECVVMPDGSVGDARVMRSLDPVFGLDEEAIAAAKRWRFRPGRLNGQPVPVIVTIELMFSVR